MKINKMFAVTGIVLLMSPIVLRSAIIHEPTQSWAVRSRLTEDRSKGKIAKEPSDEEIMAGNQLGGPINEVTGRGMPRLKMNSDQSLSDIREYYKRWATVDKQGAASEFKPQKQA